MSKADEMVLCVKRVFIENILGTAPLREGFIEAKPETLKAILHHTVYMRRGEGEVQKSFECEADPSFKQIIPYIVVRQGGMVMAYNRMKSSGETRLIGKASIGIGGHIGQQDELEAKRRSISVVEAAAARELNEELKVFEPTPEFRFIGYINNEDDKVGQVHFGVLMEWSQWSGGKEPEPNSEDIGNTQFAQVRVLHEHYADFERWSQIVISYMYGGPAAVEVGEKFETIRNTAE